MARRGAMWFAALAVAVTLAGCGGPVDEASSAAERDTAAIEATTAPATASGSPSPTSPTGEPEPTTSPPRTNRAQAPGDVEVEGLAYVPWGPDDPPVPQRYASLAASSSASARCDDAQAAQIAGAFWDLAVSVCRAVAGQAAWPSTTAVPAPPPAANAYEACLDAEVAAMLQRALRWHAANPQTTPRVRYAASGARSPCQTKVFEARVISASDGLYPGDVPAGQLAVLVFAGSADADSTVTVAGRPAEVVLAVPSSGAATLVVLVAAPAQATTAPVAVATTRGVLTSTVALPAGTQTGSAQTPPASGGATPSSSPSGGTPSAPTTSPAGTTSP